MDTHKILSADLIDILFENRNQAYGAYSLRKQYNAQMLRSLIIVFALCILLFILLRSGSNDPMPIVTRPYWNGTTMGNPPVIKKENFKTGRKKSINNRQIKGSSRNIKIVKGSTSPITTILGSGIADSSDIFSTDSIITDGPPKVPLSGGGKVPGSDTENFIKPESIDASFPGGEIAWRKYLLRHLNADVASDNNAPAGVYRVVVRFRVNTTGELSDVIAETTLGYGMEAEAIRIIRKGPLWVPASQNNNRISAYRRQPVIFIVQEQ